ncbi:MAG: HAMP domain-containing sensor histidine kinase, partial [Nannocystaceae bacterium]
AARLLTTPQEPMGRAPLRGAAGLLVEDIRVDAPREEKRAALDRIAARMQAGLVLWDPSGEPIATEGVDAPAIDPDERATTWQRYHGDTLVTVRLDDGRRLGVVLHGGGFPAPSHFVLVFAVLALTIGTLCYPLARRITRRLEALQRGVVDLGAGDLKSRAPVAGHDEIAALARHFNRAADKIEALVAGQRRMIASASHELRSPLARLRMAIELLGEGDEGKAELAQGAIRDVQELDALVGDLLLASRLEAGPSPRERVDLAAIAAEEAERAGATILSSGTAPVDGDPAALRRMIRNLLENAARHGAPPIEVTIGARGGLTTVTVDDRGPGVPEAERERIFDAFYRPAGHREGDGGVGLGLALVRQIAGLHGGGARFEARPGGGGRFLVEVASVGSPPASP